MCGCGAWYALLVNTVLTLWLTSIIFSYINNPSFSCSFMKWFYHFLFDHCNNLLVLMVDLHMLWNLFNYFTRSKGNIIQQGNSVDVEKYLLILRTQLEHIYYVSKKATNFARWWNFQSFKAVKYPNKFMNKGWFQPFALHHCVSRWV